MNNSKKNILVLGELLYDRIPLDHTPDAPKKLWLGGAPTNVSIGLATHFPKHVFLLTGLGSDAPGRSAREVVNAYNVNTDLSTISDHPTRIVNVALYEDGEKAFIDFDESPTNHYADEMIDEKTIEIAFQEIKPQILYHGSLLVAKEECRRSLQKAHERAKKESIICFMDINLREPFFRSHEEMISQAKSLLSQVDILKISDDEITALYPTHKPDHISLLHQLNHDYPNLELILFTAGVSGSLALYNGEIIGKLQKTVSSALDTTGAGDAYCAGALAQITTQLEKGKGIDQLDVELILENAQKQAQASTRYPGAVSYIEHWNKDQEQTLKNTSRSNKK